MRTIGIAIPTWNRFEQTVNSFIRVLSDDRVEEVTIVDDASTDDSFHKLTEFFSKTPKVNLFRNTKNLDCYFNKHQAMENSTSEWNILLDSDNTITHEYLDAIYAIPKWEKDTIYQPSWAKPHFDFRQWEGLMLTKENVAQYADTHLMTSLNACNHFVNREQYLKVFDGSVNPISSDSIYFMYCWLKNDGKIYITPNLTYQHYISPNNDGHYQQNSHLTVEFHEDLMKKIKQLK